MLDPNKSPMLERVGAVVALSVVVLMAWSLLLPFIAAQYHLTLTESDRALLSQVETTINNVFIAVVSFFFGASVGNRSKDESISKLVSTAQSAQAALTPAPTAQVPLAAGEQVVVKADPVPSTEASP